MSHFAYFIIFYTEKSAILLNKRLKYLGFANNKSEASTLQTQRKQTTNQNKKKDSVLIVC